MAEASQEQLYAALFGEVREWAGDNDKRRIQLLLALEGICKDPSLLQMCAADLINAVMRNDPLSPIDRVVISSILIGVAHQSEVASSLFGHTYRGAPRKGAKGLSVAKDVVRAVQGGAPSMESAWEIVANERQISFDSVKKYWIQWKREAESLLEATGGRRRSISEQVKSNRQAK